MSQDSDPTDRIDRPAPLPPPPAFSDREMRLMELARASERVRSWFEYLLVFIGGFAGGALVAYLMASR